MSQIVLDTVVGRLQIKDRWLDVGDELYLLSPREFDLMKYLMLHPNQVCARKEIVDEAWGGAVTEANVTYHVKQLRDQIKQGSRLIRTVPNSGYIILTDTQRETAFNKGLNLLEGSEE